MADFLVPLAASLDDLGLSRKQTPSDQTSGSEQQPQGQRVSATRTSVRGPEGMTISFTRTSPDESSGLRSLQQERQSYSPDPFTELSQAGQEQRLRNAATRDALDEYDFRALQRAKATETDPMMAEIEARKKEQAYQRALPASLDEMNRLGISGPLTAGEASGLEGQLALERGKISATVDAEQRRLQNAEELEKYRQGLIANREFDPRRQAALEELRQRYGNRVAELNQDKADGKLNEDEFRRQLQLAQQELSLLSDQISGRGTLGAVSRLPQY